MGEVFNKKFRYNESENLIEVKYENEEVKNVRSYSNILNYLYSDNLTTNCKIDFTSKNINDCWC